MEKNTWGVTMNFQKKGQVWRGYSEKVINFMYVR